MRNKTLRSTVRVLFFVLALGSGVASALSVDFRPVAAGVYAHIGDTGPRTVENEGLNANIGLVVGVLIEVPVMLLVVRIVNRSKGWYEAGARR